MTGRHVPPASPELVKWMRRSACRDRDPGMFFPADERSTQEAKSVCRECPVRDHCLAYAVDNRITDGVWGGLSELERRALRRR